VQTALQFRIIISVDFHKQDNIKMDLREVGWGHALDRNMWRAVLIRVMNHRLP
jgi:hypothetical protein